jgi:hypothetical protein
VKHLDNDCPCGGHGFQFAGYGVGREGWCSRPNRLVNLHTGEWYESRCKSARPSRCEYCAEVKRQDIAAIARSGWSDMPVGWRAFWCSLTAPGEDVLPFDRSLCTHHPDVRCSGKDLGCQVEAFALAIWHNDLGLRWSHFVHDLRRLLNPGCEGAVSEWPVQVEFIKTYEPQGRGALHAHPMMRVRGPVSDTRFRACYRRAALRNGFGKQMVCNRINLDQADQADQTPRKAGYIAKYATKSADALPQVHRLNSETGEMRQGGFRSWSASRQWGDTMKDTERRRALWVAQQVLVTGGVGVPRQPEAEGGRQALDLYQDFYAEAGSLLPVGPSAPLL